MTTAAMTAPLYISETDVAELTDMGAAIAALQQVLEAEASGQAQNMQKTHLSGADGSILHALGGTVSDGGFAGTKTWTYTKSGSNPLLVLFDSVDGSLRAVIEALNLGALRTGAISGVATHWMAAPGKATFAIVGTGKQALTQAAAVTAVRECSEIRVYSRDRENRLAFCNTLAERVGVNAEPTDTLKAALDGANILTLITRSQEPFLRSEMLADGTHINAAGAIVPAYAEFEPGVLQRCNRVVVDSISSVRTLSREFGEYYGSDETRWLTVSSLATLARSRENVASSDGLTLFKSMGMGLSDLALGIHVYREALRRGAGVRIKKTTFVPPNYRATAVAL